MKGYNKHILKFSTQVPVRIRANGLAHQAPLMQVCGVPTQQVLEAPSFIDDKNKAQRHLKLCPRSCRVLSGTVGPYIQAPRLWSLRLFTSVSPSFCMGAGVSHLREAGPPSMNALGFKDSWTWLYLFRVRWGQVRSRSWSPEGRKEL